MFAVTVQFQIVEGQMNAFMRLMIGNAQTSLKEETGCSRFDVCTDPAHPGEVFLYEIYDDEAAFKVHLETTHFKTFDAKVSGMIARKTVRTYKKVTA